MFLPLVEILSMTLKIYRIHTCLMCHYTSRELTLHVEHAWNK